MERETAFSAYSKLAKMNVTDVEAAGRYQFQENDEKKIFDDILWKLELSKNDRVLDIGCGPGALLIPASGLVREITGIDNENSINRCSEKLNSNYPNVELIVGEFNKDDFSKLGKFNKIIVYGVLHCLNNLDEVNSFVNKAMSLLSLGGRLLLGDVPNTSKKNRYINSSNFKSQKKEWASKSKNINTNAEILKSANQIGGFSDVEIMDLLISVRRSGYESFLIPQNENLPYGITREDILITRNF